MRFYMMGKLVIIVDEVNHHVRAGDADFRVVESLSWSKHSGCNKWCQFQSGQQAALILIIVSMVFFISSCWLASWDSYRVRREACFGTQFFNSSNKKSNFQILVDCFDFPKQATFLHFSLLWFNFDGLLFLENFLFWIAWQIGMTNFQHMTDWLLVCRTW